MFGTLQYKTISKVKFRTLGKTGLKISEISLGTWQVGGGWGGEFDKRTAQKIIETALDQGVNFLDTADVYDAQQSEKIVGEYVKADRNNLLIATKIGRRLKPHTPDAYTPDAMEYFVDDALRNTGLDYLDLVQLHCPPTPVYHHEEVFTRLDEIKKKGKVRHFGVSVEKVEEAITASDFTVVESVQIIFNMFRLKPLEECFKTLSDRNVGIIARVPLASGLLSGKMSVSRVFDEGDHRYFNRNGEAFDKGETFSGVPLDVGIKAVEELKKAFGDDLYQYALKWILMFPEVSTVIPGASRPAQVVSNITATSLPDLTEDQMRKVQEIYDKYIRKEVHEMW